MKIKSPFFVIENFIEPLTCEDIISRLDHTVPNYNSSGKPEKTIKFNRLTEIRLLPSLEMIIPDLETYYGYQHKGLTGFTFEWYPQGFQGDRPRCENSEYIDKRWTRVNNNDFCGLIILNEYNDKPPFDPYFEVNGGKINFPNHKFSFNPKRGTLIVFPGNENFLNFVGQVKNGDLNLIRYHITAEKPYRYDIKNFPGDYKSWFS
jgi:hypothetical protein